MGLTAISARHLVFPRLISSDVSALERTELVLSKLAAVRSGHEMQTGKERSRSEMQ